MINSRMLKVLGIGVVVVMLFLSPLFLSVQGPTNILFDQETIEGRMSEDHGTTLGSNETEALSWGGIVSGGARALKSPWVRRVLSNGAIIGAGAFTLSEAGTDLRMALESFFVWIVQQLTFLLGLIVGLIGSLFDFFLFYTISSTSYRIPFVEIAWEIVRDLTNIVFIFILLKIAFQLVIGTSKNDSKKQLMNTILIALVVNFSLFLSWMVVDSSNLLAHALYRNIQAPYGVFVAPPVNDPNLPDPDGSGSSNQGNYTAQNENNPTKSISAELISSVRLDNVPDQIEQEFSGTGIVLLVYIFIFLILLFAGKVLFNLALLMLTRTIGLMILAVMSPLAFVSIPLGFRQKKWIGFDSWFNQLLSLAFTAPVFVFFVYIIVIFSHTPFYLPTAPGLLNLLLHILIPLSAILFFLSFAMKKTTEMAGEFGTIISEKIQQAVGGTIAAGSVLATGGAAMAGLGIRGAGLAAGIGAKEGSARAKLAGGLSSAGKRAMAFKADPTKIPGYSRLVGEKNAKMIGKVTGKSARDLQIMGYKGIEATKDFLDGRGTKEAEHKYQQDKREILDNSGKWQEKIVDTESATLIRDEADNLEKTTNVDATLDPRGGGSRSLEDFAKVIRQEFSEAVVLQPTAVALTDTQLGSFNSADLPTSMAGTTHISAGESRIQFEEKVVKEFDKDIDNLKSDVKSKERDFSSAQASGNTTAMATTKASLETAERVLKDKEKKKEDFEKLTAKKQLEKVENLEKTTQNRAKESIAKRREKEGDKSAADRIRSGKVKIDTKKDDEKK